MGLHIIERRALELAAQGRKGGGGGRCVEELGGRKHIHEMRRMKKGRWTGWFGEGGISTSVTHTGYALAYRYRYNILVIITSLHDDSVLAYIHHTTHPFITQILIQL